MWGNERSLRKLCIRNVLSFLGTKTRKHVNTWRNSTLPETCILSVFHIFFNIKTPKCMESHLYGKTKRQYKNDIFFIVYERVIQKKKHGKNLIHENKTTLRKTCLLSDFEIVT